MEGEPGAFSHMSDVKNIHDFTHGRHVLLFMRYVTRNLKLCTSASGTPPHVQRVEILYRLPLSSQAILSLSLPHIFPAVLSKRSHHRDSSSNAIQMGVQRSFITYACRGESL